MRLVPAETAPSLPATLASNARTLGAVTAVLWGVEIVDLVLGGALDAYGVVPRTIDGLSGIPAAPFLHAGFAHLAMNTVGLWMLGALSMARRRADFWIVGILAALTAGVGAWLVGGAGTVHIGASGVLFGYLGFLLGRAVFERTAVAVALGLGVMWLAGGMLVGLLPTVGAGISWEAHLFGFIGGVLAARLLAAPPRPRPAIGS